jgi:hypothetical protein
MGGKVGSRLPSPERKGRSHRTIVGGRPSPAAEADGSTPTGIQRLLAAASLDPELRTAVARDPLLAASSIGIELSPSEGAILTSVSAEQLALMVDSMGRQTRDRRQFLATAAGAAVAIAAGVGTPASGQHEQDAHRIRGHIGRRQEIVWEPSLDIALSTAREQLRAVMVVFAAPVRGNDQAELQRQQELGRWFAPGRRLPDVLHALRFLSVTVIHPDDSPQTGDDLATVRAEHAALATKYGVDGLPAVVLLDPASEVIDCVAMPTTEAQFEQALLEFAQGHVERHPNPPVGGHE